MDTAEYGGHEGPDGKNATNRSLDTVVRLAPEPSDSRWDPETLPDDEADDEPRWTELQMASRRGDLRRVTEILSQCEDEAQRIEVVNARPVGWYGQTALQAACFHEHEEVVRALLAAGADISAPGGNNMYQNAFEYACGTGNLRVVRTLLDAGAARCVNPARVTRYQGRTPVQAAAEGGHGAVVRLLLGLGADVNAPASPCGGRTALQAAALGGHAGLVGLLLARGADVNAPGGRVLGGLTALQGAARAGEAEVVGVLLRAGADVNAPGPGAAGRGGGGGTALHAAAEGGHVEVLRALLAAGADPNRRAGPRRQTPLQSAHLAGRTEVVDALVEAGAVGPRGGGRFLFTSMRARSWSRGEMEREIQRASG